MESERLDQLHRGCWDAAIGGDLYAIDRALKIMERRSKLFGLDAPNKIAQTNIADTEDKYSQMSDEELEARILELNQKATHEELARSGVARLPGTLDLSG
ncbi:MAG: hypothetical protein ACQ9MH_15700 [Nitrospinales bacterium]